MKKYLRYLGHVLIVAIFILALYLLYNKLKTYSVAQIRESIDQIPNLGIVLSLVLMVINYAILVGYDWLALKAIHKVLPIGRVALVSFVGQAVSYNFGALLGGTSVRYRFYSAWGFTISDIVRLVLMLAVTFWVGALGLCGAVFMIAPPIIPDPLLENMPIKDMRILGAILASVTVIYLVFCFRIRKPVRIFNKEFVFPAPAIAVAQCVVASVDLIAAAGCMYVLLPGDIGVTFIDFLPSYLMAQVAVVITHIPGGVGVFELVILELTHTPQEQVVFAAVLLFRLIYFILPLIAAAMLLAVYEARQRAYILRDAGRWLSVLSHTISSWLAFVGGVIFLISATLPTAFSRLPEIFQAAPKAVLGVGHLLCALSGAFLLFVSYGLEKRNAKAFWLTVWLFAAGIAGAFVKGFSWEVCLMEAVILLAICLARRRFYRNASFASLKIPFYWIGAGVTVLAFVFALGWFLYHPAWDRAARWGFDKPFNASRTLLAYICAAAALAGGWIWKFLASRKNAPAPNRKRNRAD